MALSNRTLRILTVALLTAWAAPLAGSEGTSITWEELAPGIFAVLQPPANRFNDSNSLVVVTSSEVFLIDAQSEPGTIEEIASELERRTTKPLRWLINTHWHTDHTFGNSTWRKLAPDVQLVGHETLAEDIETRAQGLIDEQVRNLEQQIPLAEKALALGKGLGGQDLDEAQQQAQRAAIAAARRRAGDLRSAPLVTPDVTYSQTMRFRPDGRAIELMHFRAHTRGDTVVWLPDRRILATGDLLDELPFGGHGYPSTWLAALRTLRALEPQLIVPGHGPVQRDLDRLDLAIELWSTLIEALSASHAEGSTLEEARKKLQLEDLRQRFCRNDEIAERNWDAFTPESVARVWAEIDGSLSDEASGSV